MKASITLAAAMAIALTQAQSLISIQNNCDMPIIFRLDNETASGPPSPPLDPGIQTAIILSKGTGQSLKFVTASNPNWARDLITFDYSVPTGETVSQNTAWYDVSNNAAVSNGVKEPFGLWAVPVPAECAVVGCPSGIVPTADCTGVKTCGDQASFILFTCYVPGEPRAGRVKDQSRVMRRG